MYALLFSCLAAFCFTQVLASSSAALLNLDRTFKIELAWLAGDAYSALGKRMDELILLCFPTQSAATSLAQCEKRLTALRDTAMFKCSSRPTQSSLEALRAVVGKMVAGSPPAESMKTAGGIYTKVWDRFYYFVRHEKDKGDIVFGEEALELKLSDLQSKLKLESRAAKLYELDIFKAMLCYICVFVYFQCRRLVMVCYTIVCIVCCIHGVLHIVCYGVLHTLFRFHAILHSQFRYHGMLHIVSMVRSAFMACYTFSFVVMVCYTLFHGVVCIVWHSCCSCIAWHAARYMQNGTYCTLACLTHHNIQCVTHHEYNTRCIR